MCRYGRNRDRRRYSDEDQERGHQEPTADAEHAGDEADCEPHREHQKDIDREVGDREIDFHSLNQTVQRTKHRICGDGRRTTASRRLARPQSVSTCGANAKPFRRPTSRIRLPAIPKGPHPSRRIAIEIGCCRFRSFFNCRSRASPTSVRCSSRMRPVFGPSRNMSRRCEATASLQRFPVGLNRSDGSPAVSSPAKAGDPVLHSAGVTGFPAFAGNDRGELVGEMSVPTDWELL